MFKFKNILYICCLFIFSFSAWSQKVNQTNPNEMIKGISVNLFSKIKSNQAQIKSNPNTLKNIVRTDLLPYVNVTYSAYKALGPKLRQTTKEERKRYVNAFSNYLVTQFAQVLTQYNKQKVKIINSPVPSNKSITKVLAVISDANSPKINIYFVLRWNPKFKKWEAFDMIAEGISLISTKQNEWSGLIRNKGINGLIQFLNSQAKANIKLTKK